MISVKKYWPDAYAESVWSIDYEKLYRMGYRGLIFDIDNTIVPHGEPSTAEADALIAEIRAMGFQVLMLSNNSIARVTSFVANMDVLYICNADKPDVRSYEEAAAMMGLPKEQILCIGDQVFTDILGANRAGIRSILVKFIGYYTEKHIGKRRRLEKVILWLYRKDRRAYNRLGMIEKESEDGKKTA
ncbi:MAG: YqeG family HAD IIIA-type phosphatase [Solobacterium sp.]|nr:YqeG family HAD IIIA-type phosphatase [Solobacterium sp.]